MPSQVTAPEPTAQELTARPPIHVDEWTKPFFEAARDCQLVLPYCAACDRYEFPGARTCRSCLSEDLVWTEVSGHGTVFSFVTFHRSFHPAFEVPYAVCLVELAEGPRLVAELLDVSPAEIVIGTEVEAVFDPAAEQTAIPIRFRPAEAKTNMEERK